jgi:hypothetical protein
MSVYCIEEISTGKKYIGQTRRREEIRFSEHRACAASGKEGPLYDAIRNGDCSFSVLETCDRKRLNRVERKWIRKENTLFPNGFNITPGGKQTRRQCLFWARRKQSIISDGINEEVKGESSQNVPEGV